jgi:hypothetical protein
VGAGRWTLDGITVPVLDMELAELESSSLSSRRDSGGGSEESFVLAKVLARSDMARVGIPLWSTGARLQLRF